MTSVTVDLAASKCCSVGVIRNGVSSGPTIYTAPVTLIVGDVWLMLEVGDAKWVVLPDGVKPRVATEADVLARNA